MLVETPTFRALCASPNATAAELGATIDLGTPDVGDAAERVYYGGVNEDSERGDPAELPYGVCRPLEEGTSVERGSTASFSGSFRLYLAVACPIPSDLLGDTAGALEDAQTKQDWLLHELAALLRQNPRLDVTTISAIPSGLSDPKDDADVEQFEMIDFNVTCAITAGGSL
jgi:hypothetical protein